MLAAGLSTYQRSEGLLGSRSLYLEQVDSTNALLMRLGEQGAPEGLLTLAEEQSAGRGRLNRRWNAPPGSCLLFSLLFRPPAPFIHTAAPVTMLCGVAAVEAVRELTGVPVMLKWPNDLIVEREGQWFKLGGMLSEVGWQGAQPGFLVVGMGINVNVPVEQLSELADNATSLLAECTRPVERPPLLEAILERADILYHELRVGGDIFTRWRARLAWLGRTVILHTPTETIIGMAVDVEASGALVLRLEDHVERRFSMGDVSLRV